MPEFMLPMREGNKLSVAAVRNAKEPGLYGDGHGLYLQVSEFNTRAWIFRFMLDGRARKMGLGPLHTVSLAEARKRAAAWRLKVHDGIDPIDERRAARGRQKVEAAKAVSFRQAAEQYIAAHRAGWRNAKHAGQWPRTLATFAYPVIGDLPVQAIDTPLVLKVLEPIWNTKNETASRLRGRVELVLDWAKVREIEPAKTPRDGRGISTSSCLPRPKSSASGIT